MKRAPAAVLRTLALLIALLPAVALADMTGQASVIDGDTIDIHGQQIRLHGIDAPEIGQVCSLKGEPWPCGRAAANLLRDLIGGQEVDCRAAAYVRLALLIGSQGLEGGLITCAEPRIRPFMTPFPLTYSRS